MKLRLFYFARLREAFGTAAETLDTASENVAGLLDELRGRGQPWSDELSSGRAFRVAVNQDMAGPDSVLNDGDEVAIFPPVTGG